MTAKKPKADDDVELVPHFIYRKGSRIAQRVIGLSPTQINDEIKKGALMPPVNLTADGRAQGWTGAQLLELQRKRLAQAEAAAAARRAAGEQAKSHDATRGDEAA
jgi:hypothetical protein